MDRRRRLAVLGGMIVAIALSGVLSAVQGVTASPRSPDDGPRVVEAFDAPTYSSPIALDAAKNLLWVVNPDDDSVSVIGNLTSASPTVLNKIFVGKEPHSVAIDTNGVDASKYRVYVVNSADNSVSIINVTASSSSSVTAVLESTVTTGAEPWDAVATPSGTRVFVSNSSQDTITVFRTNHPNPPTMVGNVDLKNSICNDPDRERHFQPRGMAVTLNSDRLYVTRFLSFTGGASPKQGTDDGHVGIVCRLDIPPIITELPTVAAAIPLAAQPTGFNNPNPPGTATSAYPNQLQSVVIRGNQAYLPNIAASPAGPLRFNVDTQAFVNVIDNAATGVPADASATKFLNLHLGARVPEAGKTRLFFANPWAIAFTNQAGAGNAYVASAGSDLLVKVNVAADGTLSFTGGVSTTRYIDLNNPDVAATSGLNAGKNPLGLVIRNDRAFVMNYVSRNVSVVDLGTDQVISNVRTTFLPSPGTQDEVLQIGAEMFFSSRGNFNRPAGTTVSTRDRLSSEGWQNCASCHFAGWTDGVVFSFGAGPRKSVPLNNTWSPHNPNDQRILNYSAIFDEVEDFEANIRNVSGPGALAAPIAGSTLDPNHGLIISDTGDINFAPGVVNSLLRANGGRPQVTVSLPGSSVQVPALTALKEWVRFAIRTPNGMLTTNQLTSGGGNATGGLNGLTVAQGRIQFLRACADCHGGTKWTVSNKDFTSPPPASEVFTENPPVTTTVNVQYLNRFLADIGSYDLGVAGGANLIGGNIGAVEKAANGTDALGKDFNGDGKGIGFNIPGLLGIWHLPPYYHNGSCETLKCVVDNTKHRTANGTRPDPLPLQSQRDAVVEFLKSLDAETQFPTNLRARNHDLFLDPPIIFVGQPFTVGLNINLFGTKPDLLDVISPSTSISVAFGGPGPTQTLSVPVSAFSDDFAEATARAVFTAPAAPGVIRIRAIVDSNNKVIEASENDNAATRLIRVRALPADGTPPVVNSMVINADAAIATTTTVSITINALDPDPAGPEAPSGLKEFCIVKYRFNTATRLWEETECTFANLPAPSSPNTFIINNVSLPFFEGTLYAFAWVRDTAGNISRTPGFDFISYVPAGSFDINRNDVRLIRLSLTEGVSMTFSLTHTFGDVDISVFDGFSPTSTRVALSANNGSQNESVTVAAPTGGGSKNFQIELRAIVNSRVRVTFSQGSASGATLPASGSPITPTKTLPLDPVISGPPALQTAIGEDAPPPTAIFLPINVQRFAGGW